ncbi:MAG: metallophosphoesterase [Tannerellaceae bacterium]
MVKVRNILLAFAMLALYVGCDKVEPTGILIGNTNVNDRVKQSIEYYSDDKNGEKKKFFLKAKNKEYSFLIVADSHTTNDLNRLTEFFDEASNGNYLFSAHLGDFAETKSEYYHAVDTLLQGYENKLGDDWHFYPVVGNHDISHSGWSLFNLIFGASTYFVMIEVDANKDIYDLCIFLDSANASLGKEQMEFLRSFFEDEMRKGFRNYFVFTHNPFFRPRTNVVSSNFPREELYYLLNLFAENNVNYVFSGHLHAHGENTFRGVKYITMDAFSERNNPEKGEMVKITCKENGDITYELLYVK